MRRVKREEKDFAVCVECMVTVGAGVGAGWAFYYMLPSHGADAGLCDGCVRRLAELVRDIADEVRAAMGDAEAKA